MLLQRITDRLLFKNLGLEGSCSCCSMCLKGLAERVDGENTGLCIASCLIDEGVDGMHKRENFLLRCDGVGDFGPLRLLFMAGSKVIGSSE